MQGTRVFGHVRQLVALTAVVLTTGCLKQVRSPEAPTSAAPRAEASRTVEPQAEFAFTDVTVRYTEPKLSVAYTVSNRGTKRGRSGTCLEVLDKDGFLIERLNPGDFSLRPGDSDQLEEEVELDARYWAQARSLRLYAGEDIGCFSTPAEARSPLLHLELSGMPLPPGTPAPEVRPEAPFMLEAGSAPMFAIEDVEWSQERETGTVTVSYKVTNLSSHRASGSLCVRFYTGGTCDCRSIENSDSGRFNLAPGASERISGELLLFDDSAWNWTRQLKLYASRFGCVEPVEEARSTVLIQNRPESILGPPEFIPDEEPSKSAGGNPAAGRTP